MRMNVCLNNNWNVFHKAPQNYHPERTIIARMQKSSDLANFKGLQPQSKINLASNRKITPPATKLSTTFFDSLTSGTAHWISEIPYIGNQLISSSSARIASLKAELFRTTEKPLRASFWQCLTAACLTASVAAVLFATCPTLAILPLTEVACWLFCTAAIKLLNHFTEQSNSNFAKGVRWLHATIMDINYSILSACLFPLTLIPSYHDAKGNPNGRPILMINGYLGYGSNWHVLRERLAHAGCGPIYTMNIGSFESIVEYATYVQDRIKTIQNETGRKDIALICHSKGGLVGAYYATQLAPSDGTQVTDIITISSPLGGTPVAKYALGQDAKEMNLEHPFHANLKKEIYKHPEIRFFNIASEADTIVPVDSALLNIDPSRQKIFKDFGHLGSVFSSRTANQILTWLQV